MISDVESFTDEEQLSGVSLTDTDYVTTTEQDFECWFPLPGVDVQGELIPAVSDLNALFGFAPEDPGRRKSSGRSFFIYFFLSSLALLSLFFLLRLLRQRVALSVEREKITPKDEVLPPDEVSPVESEEDPGAELSKPFVFALRGDLRLLEGFLKNVADVKEPADATVVYGHNFLGGDEDALRGFVAFAKEKLNGELLTQEPEDHAKRVQRDWTLCKLHLVALSTLELFVLNKISALGGKNALEKEKLKGNLLFVYERKRIIAENWNNYHRLKGISPHNQSAQVHELLRSFSIHYARQENLLKGKDPMATPAAQGIKGIPKKIFADLCEQLDPTDRWLCKLII